MYFIVHAAFVRIKLMMMMMINSFVYFSYFLLTCTHWHTLCLKKYPRCF